MLLQSALAAVLLCIAFHGFKASAGRGKYKLLERCHPRVLAPRASKEFDKTLRIHRHCHRESEAYEAYPSIPNERDSQ